MQYVSGPIQWPPAPPSFDELAEEFGGDVFAFVPQRHLEQATAGADRTNGEITAIALSYTLFVNPDDLDDPVNVRHLPEGERFSEATPGSPGWIQDLVRRDRYPMLWDVLRTSTLTDALTWGSVAAALGSHLDRVASGAADPQSGFTGLDDPEPLDPSLAQECTLEVAGALVPGIRIERRGHRGYAATIGDRVLSVVLADTLPVELELRFD